MAAGGGGARGAVGGVGASSPPPRCAALAASGGYGGGDLRDSLREVFERLVADGYVDVESAASCVGASSPPPPPRCATPPPTLVASGWHGGGDLRDSLRCSSGSSPTATWTWSRQRPDSCVGASSPPPPPPPPPRCATPPPTLVASGWHGGGDLRDSLREVFEWLVANGYEDVASAVSGVGAKSPTSPPRCAALPPALLASGGHGSGDLRVSLRKVFERLVADGYVDLASAELGSPFRLCTINIGRFRASYPLNLNAENSEAMVINRKDLAEANYPQGRSAFHHRHPRIQELNVDGTNCNAHAYDLALLITKPKLPTQPSLLLSDIGLKSRKGHVFATTDVNSAIREFGHANIARLIGSCTNAPQFCLTTDYMPGGSLFYFLHHEHDTRTYRWMTPEVLTCGQCETSAATIQYLIRRNSILEQNLEVLSEHNIAAVHNTNISGNDTQSPKPESVEDSDRNFEEAIRVRETSNTQTSGDDTLKPESAPNSDTESAVDFQEEMLMGKFNKMLVDCVFFAMPQVLIFFPRYQASEEKPGQRLSLMAITQHTNIQSNEKAAVILFFVMFVSAWLLGLVLSLFGRGRRCTAVVSGLTLWTVGSTVAFIDYMLCKCLPEDAMYTRLFRLHSVAMCVGIAYIWFTYVRVPKFPSIRLPSCQCVFDRLRGWRQNPPPSVHDAKAKDELKRPFLPV